MIGALLDAPWAPGVFLLLSIQLMVAGGGAALLLARPGGRAATARARLGAASLIAVVLAVGVAWAAGTGYGAARSLAASADALHAMGAGDLLVLARRQMEHGEYARAAATLRRAAATGRDGPDVQLALGEALVFAAGNRVGDDARAAFERVLAQAPQNPGARYYLAVREYQHGDYRGALARLAVLAKDSRPQDPWMPLVRDGLREARAKLGLPADAPADSDPRAPTPDAGQTAAIMAMAPDDRSAMIKQMVAGLAQRLADDPKDLEGWLRLANAYRVLGRIDEARAAYAKAAKTFPEARARIDGLARGLPAK